MSNGVTLFKNIISRNSSSITAGDDLEFCDHDGKTPLYLAAENGHIERVEELLFTDANPNSVNKLNGYSPLTIAAANGHTEIVELLLATNGDPNQRLPNGQTMLYRAAECDNLKMVNILLKAGANKSRLACELEGWSPLMAAAERGHLDIVKALLTAEVDPDIVSSIGVTALFLAAHMGHLEIVKALLAKQANPNIIQKDGFTALAAATLKNHGKIVELLLEANADPNAGNCNAKPLAITVTKDNLDLTKLLIEHKADCNQRLPSGNTLLGYALENNLIGTAEVLNTMNASQIPLGQHFFMDRMQIRDPASKKGGYCSGLASTGMQYFFADELDQFNAMGERTAEIKKEEFENHFDTLKIKHVAFIAEAKKELCQEIEREYKLQINPETIWDFAIQDNQLPPVLNMLDKENANPLSIAIDHSSKLTKEQRLNNAARSVFGKKLQAKLVKHWDEKNKDSCFETLAFLEGSELFQNTSSYKDLFDDKHKPMTQSTTLSLPILMTKKLEEKNIVINRINNFCGAYSEGGLHSYFDSLQTTMEKVKSSVRFVLLLRSSYHTIMVGYDPSHTPPWALIDANDLPAHYFKDHEIYKKVSTALSDNGKTAFITEIYGADADRAELLKIIDAWKENLLWKKIHTVSSRQAEIVDFLGGSLLYIASIDRDFELVNKLIQLKVNVNQVLSTINATALLPAVMYGDLKIAKALLKAGADPNILTTSQETVLHIAAEKQNIDMVKLLIQFKANPNLPCKFSPLSLAAQHGNLDIIDVLLKAGAHIDECEVTTVASPLFAAIRSDNNKVVKKFLKAGANTTAVAVLHNQGFNPLQMAALLDRNAIMETLLQAGIEIDFRTIHIATMKNNPQGVRLCIAYGAAIFDILTVSVPAFKATQSDLLIGSTFINGNAQLLDLFKYAKNVMGNSLRENALRTCCFLGIKSDDEFNQRFNEFKDFDTIAEKLRTLDVSHKYSNEINQAYQDYANRKKNPSSILLEFKEIENRLKLLTITNFWERGTNTQPVLEEQNPALESTRIGFK